MKQSLLLIFVFLFQSSFGQYKVDTALRGEYRRMFERLPEKVKEVEKSQFENGLGILFNIKTDTLNKADHEPVNTSLKIFSIDEKTGEKEPMIAAPGEEETITEAQPTWLGCGCRLKGDTFEVASGVSLFSGFAVITSLHKDKAKAVYSEFETEGKAFRTKLSNKRVSEFTVPATINSLTIDRKPEKGINEIYGKIAVVSNGYYSYLNAWGFKHDYIYKRKHLEFYFHCNATKQRTTSASRNKG
ncbi:hypothetical protein [Flavisolibacter nicotianae]|uniref:hypothetical protein n=1 Tax=Flavisolibacter nicotianae TaxID=2364882 RepID=UPI000EAE68FC|nr:hypothetical protein [Flavisolibacter nicotianae]